VKQVEGDQLSPQAIIAQTLSSPLSVAALEPQDQAVMVISSSETSAPGPSLLVASPTGPAGTPGLCQRARGCPTPTSSLSKNNNTCSQPMEALICPS